MTETPRLPHLSEGYVPRDGFDAWREGFSRRLTTPSGLGETFGTSYLLNRVYSRAIPLLYRGLASIGVRSRLGLLVLSSTICSSLLSGGMTLFRERPDGELVKSWLVETVRTLPAMLLGIGLFARFRFGERFWQDLVVNAPQAALSAGMTQGLAVAGLTGSGGMGIAELAAVEFAEGTVALGGGRAAGMRFHFRRPPVGGLHDPRMLAAGSARPVPAARLPHLAGSLGHDKPRTAIDAIEALERLAEEEPGLAALIRTRLMARAGNRNPRMNLDLDAVVKQAAFQAAERIEPPRPPAAPPPSVEPPPAIPRPELIKPKPGRPINLDRYAPVGPDGRRVLTVPRDWPAERIAGLDLMGWLGRIAANGIPGKLTKEGREAFFRSPEFALHTVYNALNAQLLPRAATLEGLRTITGLPESVLVGCFKRELLTTGRVQATDPPSGVTMPKLPVETLLARTDWKALTTGPERASALFDELFVTLRDRVPNDEKAPIREAIGLSDNQLFQIRTGKKLLPFENLEPFAKLLQTTPQRLFLLSRARQIVGRGGRIDFETCTIHVRRASDAGRENLPALKRLGIGIKPIPAEGHGAAIAGARERLRLSQAQLAARARVTEETIARMEGGGSITGLETLCRLAQALRSGEMDGARIYQGFNREIGSHPRYADGSFAVRLPPGWTLERARQTRLSDFIETRIGGLNITQMELARSAAVDPALIKNLLTGNIRTPSSDKLTRLASALQVDDGFLYLLAHPEMAELLPLRVTTGKRTTTRPPSQDFDLAAWRRRAAGGLTPAERGRYNSIAHSLAHGLRETNGRWIFWDPVKKCWWLSWPKGWTVRDARNPRLVVDRMKERQGKEPLQTYLGRFGIPYRSFRDLVERRTVPSAGGVERLCRALDLPAEVLIVNLGGGVLKGVEFRSR